MPPVYEYACGECGSITDEFRKYEDRERPSVCACGEAANYIISAPTVLQASYLDGQRKKYDSGWQRLKEMSKLKLEHARAKTKQDKDKIKDQMDVVNGKTPPKRRKRPSEIFDKD
jgi:putative FmdB family regulatory protein